MAKPHVGISRCPCSSMPRLAMAVQPWSIIVTEGLDLRKPVGSVWRTKLRERNK